MPPSDSKEHPSSEPPGHAPAPKEEQPAAVQQPAGPKRPRDTDLFQDGASQRKPAFVLKPEGAEPRAALPRSRVLDPRLIPVVPPSVTTDPSRQFHALLGIPRIKAKPLPSPPPEPPPPPPPPPREAPPEIERILATLAPARASIIRQVLTGKENRRKRGLRAFLEDSRFKQLDFEGQRRALAAFDLQRR